MYHIITVKETITMETSRQVMSAVPPSEPASPWPDYDRQVSSLSDWLILTASAIRRPVVVGDIANIEETVAKCKVSLKFWYVFLHVHYLM